MRNIVHYSHPGNAWHDLSSHEATVAIVLGQVGGYCEPRLNLNRPTARSRFGAGHATFVPSDMTVWGYTDGLQSIRELRMSFAPKVLESIIGDDLDPAKTDTPVLLLYDDKVARCAELLADECQESSIDGRLYGESLTTALTATLFTRRNTQIQRANGLSRWQLRRVTEQLHISKEDDRYLRSLIVQAAHYILGPSTGQRSAALRMETGRVRRK